MKLILFDIDGTILWTDGAGRRAMEASLREHFGVVGPPSYRYDGKTDVQIVRECMRACGIDDDRIDRGLPVVLEAYLTRLDAELTTPGRALRRFGRRRCSEIFVIVRITAATRTCDPTAARTCRGRATTVPSKIVP